MNPPSPPLRQKLVSGAARLIAGRPRTVAAVVFLVLAFLWAHLPRLAFRTDVDDFVVENDPVRRLGLSAEAVFTRNEHVIAAFETPDIFTPENLGRLRAATDALRTIEGVADAISLARVEDMKGTEDAFVVEPLVEDIPPAGAAMEALRRRALENPLYRNALVSVDGRVAAIVVHLAAEPPPGGRAGVVAAIEKTLAGLEKDGPRYRLAGWPITNVKMARFTNADVVRFVPLTLLLTLVTLWWVFRNPRLLLMAGGGILFTLAATMGLAGLCGIPVSMTVVAVVPLVITLALSDLVHLFTHLNEEAARGGATRREALTRVLEPILFPCFLTSVNTAIGFASLTLTPLPAVGWFGFLAAAGMFFEFLITFGIVAPGLLLFPVETIYRSSSARRQRAIPRVVSFVHGAVRARPRTALVLCLAAAGVSLFQARRVRVETSPMEFFPPSNAYRQDIEFVRDRLAGVTVIDLLFRAPAPNAFRDPGFLRDLRAAQEKIEALPGVDKAISLTDFFMEMNEAFHADDPAHRRLPGTRRMVDQYLLLYGGEDMREYVNDAFNWTRVRVRLRPDGSAAVLAVLDRIRAILGEKEWRGAEWGFVGKMADLVRSQVVMVDGQVQNILSAVLGIGLVMAVVLRSLPLTLLFLVPNIFPVLVNFGLMGAWGITLNTGTALIAASAFGIIVDDTVHFFVRYRERRWAGAAVADALHDVTEEKGEASLSAAFVLSMGFGVLMLSEFEPIFYYGLLNVAIMAVGMAGDMVLLKSLFYVGLARRLRSGPCVSPNPG